MIVVHHLENSRSQRVIWLLEELGVPYSVKRYERDKKTMLAPPELKAVHPLGKSPVITDDGEANKETIAETGAIIEYLLERYGNGRLIPAAGTPERRRYTYWLHYSEGSIMPLLVMKLIFTATTRAPTPWLIRPIAKGIAAGVGQAFIDPNLKRHLALIESDLATTRWFAGAEITAADIVMSFPLQAAMARARGGVAYPNIAAFLTKIEARPAYKKALEVGGPFALLS